MAFPIAIGMVAESTQSFLNFTIAHVYILYSQNLNKFYIGSCLDLSERLENHKNKLYPNCYTAKDSSWKLFFEIPNLEYQQARGIENHIKKMKSSKYISNLLKHPEIVEKLKDMYP